MDRYFMVSVESEAINYVAYWTGGGILEVGFNHGGIYRYTNVPLQMAVNFVTADSVGNFFHRNIRGRFGS